MKKHRFIHVVTAVTVMLAAFSSCTDDNDTPDLAQPTALVTVCPDTSGGFVMHLDDSTRLIPTNMPTAPFDGKEVRAIVNYAEIPLYYNDAASSPAADPDKSNISVKINWIDSIRTKLPVDILATDAELTFGNDPIEIINDWVTVAEDGYLTLRIRTQWGSPAAVHSIDLLTGTNPSDPYELELRHDAAGDTGGEWGDALIAFNLNGLHRPDGDNVRLKLRWRSFTGDKSAEFKLRLRKRLTVDPDEITHSRSVR